MKVRFKYAQGFPSVAYAKGEIADLPDDKARKFIEMGMCEDASNKPKAKLPETKLPDSK